MSKKIKFLKFQLATAIFVLLIMLISGFFILGPELSQVAKAVLGDYNRTVSGDDQITVANWDQLDEDFLDKQNPAGDSMAGNLTVPSMTVLNDLGVNGNITSSQTQGTDSDDTVATKGYVDASGGGNYVDRGGDTMTGDLVLPQDPDQPLEAATKQYVDSAVVGGNYVDESGDTMTGNLDMGGNGITNLGAPTADGDAVSRGVMNTAISGAMTSLVSDIKASPNNDDLKMVCGQTVPGFSGWTNTGRVDACSLIVSFPDVGFTSNPQFFTSLEGANTYRVIGSTSIYSKSTTGFRILIVYREDPLPGDFDCVVKAENEWNWIINWCAVGN